MTVRDADPNATAGEGHAFDPDNIPIPPSDWFSPSAEYEGSCRIEFTNPAGAATGVGHARVDETTDLLIQMDVTHHECERGLTFGLQELMSGREPERKDGKTTLRMGPWENPISSLRLAAADGVLEAKESIFCVSSDFHAFSEEEHPPRLVLDPLRARFIGSGAGAPKFWVLPLANLKADIFPRRSELDRHPLRVYPTPVVPPNLPEPLNTVARINSNAKNCLIIFEFGGAPAFIERLPVYDEAVERLSRGLDRSRITAVMVGEVGDRPTGSFEEVETWIPLDLIRLIGLATGCDVGTPWIEFRDEAGALVSRIYASFGRHPYREGHVAIRHGVTGDIGRLLTQAQKAKDFGSGALRVAASNTLQLGFRAGSTIEEKFVYASRALESLCGMLGTKRRQDLPSDVQGRIDAAVDRAKAAVEVVKRRCEAEGEVDIEDALQVVGVALQNSKKPPVPFGTAVERLVDQMGLPDAQVLNAHLRNHPTLGCKRWGKLISDCRNDAIHRGGFRLSPGEPELDELFHIWRHLHDVLLRIIFKLLGYDGTYCPTVAVFRWRAPLDWVQADTPPARLGYR